MEDKEISQWFDINVQKPWEPGVYQVPCKYGWKETYFSYWCGVGFHGGWNTVEIAIQRKKHHIEPEYQKWRGLASEPSAKPKPKSNRKVTRYVVMDDIERKPIASFATKKAAENYEESMMVLSSIKKIRFRTPEA